MQDLDLESSLKLREVDEGTFENIYPPWVWHGNKVVPGGWLMSECAAAAYRTIDAGYVLDTLNTQFLAAAKPEPPIRYVVHKLSNGKRFAARSVIASQNGKNIVATTISFVGTQARNKPAMNHSVKRETKHTISKISLDDLEPKSPLGPFMKFQRLAVHHLDLQEHKAESAMTVCAAQISPSIKRPAGHISHVLGIINLSDYHVLDAPLQIYGITFTLFAINDHSRTPTDHLPTMMTSLNHTIHFHRHDGWRADELCYIEATTPWGNDGRTLVETKIFDLHGSLIATCVQETYHVLGQGTKPGKL